MFHWKELQTLFRQAKKEVLKLSLLLSAISCEVYNLIEVSCVSVFQLIIWSQLCL